MIKWLCRIVMVLLLLTTIITITILLTGRPWYYYAGACLLVAAMSGSYTFLEIWFEHRRERINPGHFNEVADRSACLANMIMRELIELPAVQQNADLKKHAEIAASKLFYVSNSAAAQGEKSIVIHDRAYMFCCAVHEMIIDNAIINEDPAALVYATAAGNNLWDLYQHLSNQYA